MTPGLASLLDIMRTFDAWGLAMLLHHIDHAIEVIKPMAESDATRNDQLTKKEVDAWLSANIGLADHFAKELSLQSTNARVWTGGGRFWMAAQVGLTWEKAYHELRFLRESIEADLETRMFAFIVPEKAKLLASMDDDWSDIWTAIPNSKEDTKEALDCYALERNTAAIFHLMRTAEWGLRAFCVHLGRLNSETPRADGSIKLTPVEFLTWDSIIKELQKDVEKKLSQIPKGPERQELLEFYHPVLLEIEAFKDAWRNHVMHTRKNYNAEDVASVLSHVKRFMQLLVANGVTTV